MTQEDTRKTPRGTGEVRVTSPAELTGKSLYDRANEMAQNRYDIFITNVKYIQSQKGITQARMCEHDLEDLLKSPQLSAYRDRDKDIPYLAMVRLATAYGYTPEQLTGQLLEKQGSNTQDTEKANARPREEYLKYVGTYHMAYFVTDPKNDDELCTTANSLAGGLMTIYAENATGNVPTLKVIAFTNCTEQEQEKLLATVRSAEASRSIRGIRECYTQLAMAQGENRDEKPRAKCLYEGEVELTQLEARITMRQPKGSDEVRITLHNRAANSSEGSPYKGGKGTMASFSRGQEHKPCVQAVILSRKGFDGVAKEEIALKLYMDDPHADVSNETKEIILCMKSLFLADASESHISQLPEEKRYAMLEFFVEMKVLEAKRNALKCFKVSIEDDAAVYAAFCR